MEYPRQRCRDLLSRYAERHPDLQSIPPGLDRPPEDVRADFSVAWPMRASGVLDGDPRELADDLASFLSDDDAVARTDVAGPGFVNLTFEDGYLVDRARAVLAAEEVEFPPITSGEDGPPSVLLEFVSANPTGPLHVGHGRGAVYGDTLGRLLELHGCDVHREYYVNDAGSQMERLGETLRIRLEQEAGEAIELEEEHYQGDYLRSFAQQNPELRGSPVDQLAEEAKSFILEDIFGVLDDCGIRFDQVTSEQELATREALDELLNKLKEAGRLETRDGAVFLLTTEGGDDKDRVLIRSDGSPTYFANDLIYHDRKFRRGHDRFVDVWGHDHHGYQKRLQVGLDFLGYDSDRLEIELYQLVDLYRDGEPVAMSTRGGEFVSLRELLEEVGPDAMRFNFLTTNHNRPLDFDIDVARSEDENNPVYYVQYAHTRMASIIGEADRSVGPELLSSDDQPLTEAGHNLLVETLEFPFVTRTAAEDRNPHNVTFALKDLAGQFHSYYGKHRVLDPEEPARSRFRLGIVGFLRRMFEAGLSRAMGVEAPRSM